MRNVCEVVVNVVHCDGDEEVQSRKFFSSEEKAREWWKNEVSEYDDNVEVYASFNMREVIE